MALDFFTIHPVYVDSYLSIYPRNGMNKWGWHNTLYTHTHTHTYTQTYIWLIIMRDAPQGLSTMGERLRREAAGSCF